MASSITTASSSSTNLSSSGFPSSRRPSPLRPSSVPFPRKFRHFTIASSISNSASHPNSDAFHFFKKSNLSTLIQEIEPLDVSLIQKDVPRTTVDAMKRTISGMLGLLPSDRFQVSIEALWEPLSKLLVSSVMTGYTLRNVEYRLSLERNLDMHHENNQLLQKRSEINGQETLVDSAHTAGISGRNDVSCNSEATIGTASENIDILGLGELTPEAQEYVLQLQSRLSSVEKELREVKRKSAALQMQHFVGEEKNDLLDYLRSLQPEKVVELSEPTCSELKETIHSVVHGLLATLSPKMHTKAPPSSESTSSGPVNVGSDDCAEILENASLQFQPLISLTRDYLARLLFWCMLLGHYLRGLEYRMQLMELLSLPTKDIEDDAYGNEQIV